MKSKLTEFEKLKYWLDTEFTILHIMFAIIMLQLTEGLLPTVLLVLYIIFCALYCLVRLSYLADDPNYLKIPKE